MSKEEKKSSLSKGLIENIIVYACGLGSLYYLGQIFISHKSFETKKQNAEKRIRDLENKFDVEKKTFETLKQEEERVRNENQIELNSMRREIESLTQQLQILERMIK